MSNPKGLTRRTLGLTAAAAAMVPQMAAAMDVVDRKDTLIAETWPAGPTFRNFGNLNPYAVGNDPRNHIVFVYEALFYWNNLKGELIPFLATGFKFNDEYTSCTVTLRAGVTWADGKPFSADDVVATYELLRQNGEGKKDLSVASDIAAVLTLASKVDDLTVRFDLKRRDPRFVLRTLMVKFTAANVFILPKHIIDGVTEFSAFTNLDIARGLPIGTGPYKVVATSPERVVLDRRDDWWGAKAGVWAGAQAGAYWAKLPAPKRIITLPRGEPQQMAQQLVSGGIDWMVEAPVPIMKRILAEAPAVTTLTDRKPPYGYIDWWPTSVWFNFESPAVKDLRLRQAMRHAINPKQIIDIFHDGAAEQAYTPFPDFPVLRPYLQDIEAMAKAKGVNNFDLRRSAALMEQAGYKKDSEGFWGKDGKRWTGEMVVPPPLELMGPIVAEQFRRAGFQVGYSRRPDFLQFAYGGRADLVMWGHGGSIYDPEDTMLLYHSKFYRPVGEITTRHHRWRNARFDALADQVGQLPLGDPALRPLVKEAFEIWLDDAVEIPIAQWYHRVPVNTTNWVGWPTEADPYQSPTVSYHSTMMVVHGLKKKG